MTQQPTASRFGGSLYPTRRIMTRNEIERIASLDWSNNPTLEFPVSDIQRRWATTNSVRRLARELKREFDKLEEHAELDETALRGEHVDVYSGKDMFFSNYEEAVEALNKLTTIKRILRNKEEEEEEGENE